MSQPTPERILNILNIFHQTEALRAGIELEVFTAIAEGNDTPESMAQRCHASERGLRILCDTLSVIGILHKNNGVYSLADDAAIFLVKNAPAYIGDMTYFINSDYITNTFRSAPQAVRKGGTAHEDEGTISEENPVWVKFAQGMYRNTKPAAEFIANRTGVIHKKPCKVLDVAGGHGSYGIAMAKRNPEAEVYILDWQSVLEVAREHARQEGVDSRYHLIPGSAFEVEWGEGYDVILFMNFFHHFDPPTCIELMRKARSALKEDGVLVTLEFIPNEDRITPPVAAFFSFTMLVNTPSGDAYTYSEYEGMFKEAGFILNELHAMPFGPQSLILSYKN